jgi:hypothetical protein
LIPKLKKIDVGQTVSRSEVKALRKARPEIEVG